MAETPAPESQPASGPSDFRWQAFFQQAGDALFVLNRQRRILFVNRAWEQLTGLPAAEARLIALACSQPPKGRARWTLRLLADQLVELEVVEAVSHETVRQVLKKTNSSRG